MEFLQPILGDELYAQFAERINAHNGNEANANNLVKLANLAGGEYVGKGKYEALEAMLTGKQSELDAANGLIEQFKGSAKGNEELQSKLTAYEQQMQQIQAQLQETKINSALKVALIAAGCSDVDYVSYKVLSGLREQGKSLELDENEHIKGENELISGAKTSLPNQFNAGNGARKVLDGGKLPTGDDGPLTVTKEQFAKMGYNDRLKLKQENEQLFRQLTNNK